MSCKSFAIVNGVIALSLFAVAAYAFFFSETTGDREEAAMVLFAAFWFLGISFGFTRRSRILVSLTSIPVIAFCVLFAFILLFGPLAWGDENLNTTYALQIGAVILGVIQIWGLGAVFAAKRTDDSTAS